MKAVTSGEVMLRLATPGFLRLKQTPVREILKNKEWAKLTDLAGQFIEAVARARAGK